MEFKSLPTVGELIVLSRNFRSNLHSRGVVIVGLGDIGVDFHRSAARNKETSLVRRRPGWISYALACPKCSPEAARQVASSAYVTDQQEQAWGRKMAGPRPLDRVRALRLRLSAFSSHRYY